MTGHLLLILVRHGRTEWNAASLFQGQADPHLNPDGVSQSHAAAKRIADELRSRDAFGASGAGPLVVSSDLSRARATAFRIASRVGATVVLDARLREIDLGAWAGLRPAQAQKRFPEEWAAWTAGQDVRRGGGETVAEAGCRVAEAIAESAGTATGQSRRSLIAVGHGLSLRSGMNRLRAGGLIELAGPAPHLTNGEVLILEAKTRPLADRFFV